MPIACQLFKKMRRFVGKYFFEYVSGFAGVTNETNRIISKEYNFSGPCTAIPYHSDLSNFQKIQQKKRENPVIRFLYLGSLIKRKRVDIILYALEKISVPCELLIVGSGAEEAILRDMATRQNKHIIRFISHCDYSKVCHLFEECDYLILPSDHDGFGMVVMEALASGIPVIASDRVMSAVEYVVDDKNGWIFPHGNPNALAKILNKATNNSYRWPMMSVQARQSVQLYSADNTANILSNFFKKVSFQAEKKMRGRL